MILFQYSQQDSTEHHQKYSDPHIVFEINILFLREKFISNKREISMSFDKSELINEMQYSSDRAEARSEGRLDPAYHVQFSTIEYFFV